MKQRLPKDMRARIKAIVEKYERCNSSELSEGDTVLFHEPGRKKLREGIVRANGNKGIYNDSLQAYWVIFGKEDGIYVPEDLLEKPQPEWNVFEKLVIREYTIYSKGTKSIIKEELTVDDFAQIREFIRRELADIFYDLFKKRAMWV